MTFIMTSADLEDSQLREHCRLAYHHAMEQPDAMIVVHNDPAVKPYNVNARDRALAQWAKQWGEALADFIIMSPDVRGMVPRDDLLEAEKEATAAQEKLAKLNAACETIVKGLEKAMAAAVG